MKVEHTVKIDTPAETVWAVTTDINNWPDWTPTVEEATRQDEGPFDVGSYARMKQPGKPEAIWEVTSITPGKGFVWEAHIRGMHFIATHHANAHRLHKPTQSGAEGSFGLPDLAVC